MQAAIIAVGSELLAPGRAETNSVGLTQELNALGIEVWRKTVIGDEVALIAAEVMRACADADLVFISGGLGPTTDDVTREGVAAALNRRLCPDAEAEAALQDFFALLRRPMPANNLRQALRLDGAELLANACGTAPGQYVREPGSRARALFLLPGPPAELFAMFKAVVAPIVQRLAPPAAICTRVLRFAGIGEARVDELAAPVYGGVAEVATTILTAGAGEIELRFRAQASTREAAQAVADGVADRVGLVSELAAALVSRDGSSLEATVGGLLRARAETLAVAESCTAGGLGYRLTAVPGSSAWFLGGAIVYSDGLKQSLADVSTAALRDHGAVSAVVARELAVGIRRRTGASWGLSITGIAGPEGGSVAKPVGTVFIGLAGPDGFEVVEPRNFPGDRSHIRALSITTALDRLRRALCR